MKFLYTLVLALAFSFAGAQATETFDGVSFTGSYTSNTVSSTVVPGLSWTFVKSRNGYNDTNGAGISLPAIMLRRASDDSKITSSLISGGVKKVTMDLYKGFTGAGKRQVELFINGASVGTSIEFDDADDKDHYVFTIDNINVIGDFTIEVRNITKKQVIVDNISWTPYSLSIKNYNLED